MRVQYELRKINDEWFKKITSWEPPQIRETFKILDSCSVKEIKYLNANKKILGDRLYTILFADILGESGLKIDNFLPYNSPSFVEAWLNVLSDYKDEVWEKYNVFKPDNNFLKYSYTYANALIARFKWDSCVLIKKPFNTRNCYAYFKSNYTGTLRERIVTTLLYENRNKAEDISNCLQSSFDYVTNRDFRRILQNIATHLTKGSIAYQFQLPDTSGVVHDYSEFKGKVVLLDFWFTGCIACLKMKPTMDSIAKLFNDNQIVFISICIDKDKTQWINSVHKNIYTSEYNINLYTEGKGDAHAIILHYLVSAYPTLILVGKDGKLSDHPFNPRIDHGRNLIELIDKNLKSRN
jgi:thiol-disulfide isomerase/thioredoxin